MNSIQSPQDEAQIAENATTCPDSKKKNHKIWWYIIGIISLILLFVDVILGLIGLTSLLVFVIIKKINRQTASKILERLHSVKGKPILLLLLFSLLIWREINAPIGISLTLISIICLILKNKKHEHIIAINNTLGHIGNDIIHSDTYRIFTISIVIILLIVNYFLYGITPYVATGLLIICLIGIIKPSLFKKATDWLAKIYASIGTSKVLNICNKKVIRIFAYIILAIVLIGNFRQTSIVSILPYAISEISGNEIQINSAGSEPAPSMPSIKPQSEADKARQELRELQRMYDMRLRQLQMTADPYEREQISDEMDAINARAEELSDWLIRHTGFPF